MNRSLVFKGKGKTSGALIRYYILCVCQMLCSWALVSGMFRLLNWEPSGLKVFVDLVLFLPAIRFRECGYLIKGNERNENQHYHGGV